MAKNTTITKPKSSKGKLKRLPVNAIEVRGDGKYPLVPLASIVIVDRPEEGHEEDVLFFNPRSIDSFDEESMESIRDSICADGLQQPPVCRAITDGDSVIRIELIAGERRLRSMLKLVEENRECYDDELGQKVPASELFEFIPVKLHYDCSDERALRLAFMENHESKSLTISEEIALVERLTRRGLNQKQIAVVLLGDDRNVTWVSQTGNFRESLPEEAFDKLLTGQLSRHVAVKLMSYKRENRQELYEQAVAIEQQETQRKLAESEDELADAEDLADMSNSDAQDAMLEGNSITAAKLQKKANSAKSKVVRANEKKERVESESGKIKQSHIDKGAAAAGVKPKKDKPLSRQEIESYWLETLDNWCVNGYFCPLTKNELPEDMLLVMYGTVKAILSGERDPAAVVRDHYVEQGVWFISDIDEDSDGFESLDDHLDELVGSEDFTDD